MGKIFYLIFGGQAVFESIYIYIYIYFFCFYMIQANSSMLRLQRDIYVHLGIYISSYLKDVYFPFPPIATTTPLAGLRSASGRGVGGCFFFRSFS